MGFTASPERGDGTPLGDIFARVVYHRGIREMVEAGWLVPPSGRIVARPLDLRGVRVRGGDYVEADLDAAVGQRAVTEAIAAAWLGHARQRTTLAFTPGGRLRLYPPGGGHPLTGELYLPKSWTDQPKRTAAAKVPAEIGFRTKPAIAAELVQRVRTWGLAIGMVHADAGYGDLGFMQQLAEQSLPYCIGVRGNFTVYLPGEAVIPAQPAPPYSGKGRPAKGQTEQWPLHAVQDVRQALPQSCWQSVSYRQDSKGVPLQRQFAAMRVQPATADMRGPEQWLLLERPLQPEGQDLKQYLISLPAETSLAELAEVAHLRAHIERESYQNAKQGVGLTDYQGRSWSGYHRHLAMAWLALTWLQRQRQPLAPPDPPPTPSSTPIAKPTAPTPDRASCPPVVQFGAEKIPLRFAELMADSPRPLPRTRRESLQAVHRPVSQWCRIAVVHEWMLLGRCLLGRCPALPLLQPALAP